MRVGIGMGMGFGQPAGQPGLPPGPTPPGFALSISPPSPGVGDLVTLTGSPSGTPLATAFATLSVSIGGTALTLADSGLQRTFVARAGALAVSASVSTTEGTALATLDASIAAGVTVASVIGFGSSTMDGDGATTTAARTLNLVAGALGAGTVRNAAGPGTVFQNSLAASGSPLANNGRDRFAAALLGANKSDRALILYGANDLRYTGAPATFNATGFANDLREVITGMILGGYARSEIIVASPNWYPDVTYSTGSAGFTGSNRMIHEAYVAACETVAAEYGLAYADVYGKMRDLGAAALVGPDNLHANDAGHQVIAHAFLKAPVLNTRAVPAPGAATSDAVQTLSLAWAAVAGAVGYTAEAGIAGTYGFSQSQQTTATSLSFTGLTTGAYVGRVRADFADGSGPWAFWSTPVVVLDGTEPGRINTGVSSFAAQTPVTLIENIVPALGTWVKHPGSTGAMAIVSTGDALRGPGSTSQFCVATLADQTLDSGVFVEMDYRIRSNSAQLVTYATARTSADSLTFLAAGYNGSAWRILKYVNGSATVLGSFAQTETIGATPVMRFEVGNGLQQLYRNDVLLVTTNEPDSGLGTLGDGLGLRMGAGSASWSSTNGPQEAIATIVP